MTDYAECPWCHVSSVVEAGVLDRKCSHARMTYGDGSTFKGSSTRIIRFSDSIQDKDVSCAVRSIMTDERFFTAIGVMDLDTIEEIERKLDHRKAELGQ